MKVFIFGSSGMLGRYLSKYLNPHFQVISIARNDVDLNDDFSAITQKYNFNSDDVIINSAGIIKQRNYSAKELIRVNSLFPHFLSTLGCNVIHVTTDCVFSGKDGSYDEDAQHDCLDDYGKSKSLGECQDLTVIRTSIIGEELQNKKSLIEWVKSNQNTTINGYLNHFWNGVTCLELAKHIKGIIDNSSYWKGVRHYFSPDTVNKYQLVSYINEIYELNNQVIPVMSEYCDRSISTKYESPVSLSIKEQLLELKQFKLYSSNKENKLKNFPSVNFISITESEKRREKLYSNLEKYEISNVTPHVYKRFKYGDHSIQFDPDVKFVFDEAYLGSFTSHLKAIREWYENTDEDYAFFCEDDISFETIEYWNFTWEEFFNKLPSDWDCVQLSLTRQEETMFFYFNDCEVHLRNRWWDDWSCLAYLLSRKHAKKLLETYYDRETFIFEYRGIDRQYRMQCVGHYYTPTNETIVYSYFDNTNIYSFPLFVEDIELETLVWNNSNNQSHNKLQIYSYTSIIDWWKTKGINVTINDIKYRSNNKVQEKLKNFPPIHFINTFDLENRKKYLDNLFKEYNLTNITPHIFKRYEDGDHNIKFPDDIPNYVCNFPNSYFGAFTSHLKAIREWYENTNEPYAFFCEDDISFETIQYWNFTWEEFFNNLPRDWNCVQLGLSRYTDTMFKFFKPEVHLRCRCWCDWGAYAYLISRDHAKRLIDSYYDGNVFIFNYKGSDKLVRQSENCLWAYTPGIETIIYSILDDKPVYTFPLFVSDTKIFPTEVWSGDSEFYSYSYDEIINWWKTKGKFLSIDDIIAPK